MLEGVTYKMLMGSDICNAGGSDIQNADGE